MLSEKKKNLLGQLLLLFATVLWGSSFSILKNTIDSVPNSFVLGVRFLTAGLIFAVIFPKKLKMKKSTFLHGVIIGLCTAAAYIVQTFGLKYTTASKNAFLTAIYVVVVPFLTWLFYKKRPDAYSFIAAALSASGMLVICFGDGSGLQIGDLLSFGCSFFYALQIIFLQKYNKTDDTTRLVMIYLFTVGVINMILSAITELPYTPLVISGKAWLSIAYLAVACTCLAQFCQAQGQRSVSSEQAALILSLESVFGTLFAVILWGETLTWNLIVGFVAIFIAIIVSETKLSFITKFFKKNKNKENKTPVSENDTANAIKSDDADTNKDDKTLPKMLPAKTKNKRC